MSDDATTHYPWPRGGIIGPNHPIALTVLSGALSGQSFELRRGEQIIGRGPQVDIRIDDTGVSREHAKLIWTPHGVFNLLDLRSTNGTAVNGNRIDVAILRAGDRIQLGPQVELGFGPSLHPDELRRREQAARRLREQLSVRQLQVAKLVAEGASNREIAERLGIRVRTVESHLDHIYGQLAIGSRTELTRAIVEAGLLTPAS